MSLSLLLLGIYLILTGLVGLAIVDINAKLLAIIALVDGILFFVEAYKPIKLFRRD